MVDRLDEWLAGILCIALVCAACTRPDARAAIREGSPPPASVETITTDGLLSRIRFLSSDGLAGRATPSPGLDLAATYIATEFEGMGLLPAGDGFVQRYALGPGPDSPTAPNVAALLPGSDSLLRDTYIVFSAHMDHLGTGLPDASGDSIYNGADDDASGTAAVLEVAEAFASMPAPPARSIVFLLVSGEELGLLGSQAFLESNAIPASRMVANINIDMIGRNTPDTVVTIGTGYSSLGSRVAETARANPDLRLTVIDDPWPAEQFFFRSDHFHFARAGVPALFFFAGVHEDYHRPSDEIERIDADKAARIARLAFLLGATIANDPNPPEWTSLGRRQVLGATGN
ncbi:MAG: M20/M25/M40 family metallo-hydrolase [Longimicrobiales bacterium]